ncbi:hypothetical protein AHM25_001606 [Salmonella enterica subsp. enterica serovar Sandiego]|nr:hypothetical protein [Salmonella enterica subsp. enterica serovar Sandiego]EHB6984356.1 hypothetical protein [Salmonella enterica subsp. enterica serovar Sandiego]EJV8948987.1 hypothetical protein [Salmonella enterica]
MICPHCGSVNTQKRNIGRKVGGGIGAIAGALLVRRGPLGAAAGSIIPGIGTIAGGVIGFLVGMGSSAALGAMTGGNLDGEVLDEYLCHDCLLTFND